MSNDMKIVKFKMMIKGICKDLGKQTFLTDNIDNLTDGYGAAWLAIIYNHGELNDYGKVIMDQVCMLDREEFSDRLDEIVDIKEFIINCSDIEYRLKAAKALVTMLNEGTPRYSSTKPLALCFIFWSLMILAVDSTDKEEHLSLICDFAKMLEISDEEIMALVQIIQVIYHTNGDLDIKAMDKDVRRAFQWEPRGTLHVSFLGQVRNPFERLWNKLCDEYGLGL